ncbi:Uncharacterized membrane protein YckC, RDD family [Flexibacter flexilis DSM 6793]|uniref:Uncharacterized membrane protein YckC, RDD family n=1 Tax=Flexibacter flexilis DSM 6793 TaxID=927664 RepID=A0A1I1JYZ8_9BACT|nr:RDD family protein [Flexibacter flexilis]SFC53481.1 Uncharacterized membrane protein YckC, RDD family [Flexibacter flexilis DSM 6793]
MQTIKVQTTQNVTIEYPIADLGKRIAAKIIDSLVLTAIAFLFITIALTIQPGEDAVIGLILTFLLIYFVYPLVLELQMDGQTFGKKIMKIKVISLDGRSAGFLQYFLRWILNLADMQMGGAVGLVVIAVNGKGQRIGDLAAGTTVIDLKTKIQDLEKVINLHKIEENYVATYANVYLLSDHDVQVIQKIVLVYRQTGNEEILQKTADKVKEQLGLLYTQTGSNLHFLETVLKDYKALTMNN